MPRETRAPYRFCASSEVFSLTANSSGHSPAAEWPAEHVWAPHMAGFMPFLSMLWQTQFSWLHLRIAALKPASSKGKNAKRAVPLSKQVTVFVTNAICHHETSGAGGIAGARRWLLFPQKCGVLHSEGSPDWSYPRALHKSWWHLLFFFPSGRQVVSRLASRATHFINLAFIHANSKGQHQQPERVSSF